MAGRTDTVVKARFSRGLGVAIRLAKEHVRYGVHRPDEHGLRQYRDLWDRDGRISKQAAYARLDGVRHGDYIYRLTLSPHPERQDAGQHLDLRSWTRDMLAELEHRTGLRVEWFAVTHEHREDEDGEQDEQQGGDGEHNQPPLIAPVALETGVERDDRLRRQLACG